VVKSALKVLEIEQVPQNDLSPPVLPQALTLLQQAANILEDKLRDSYEIKSPHSDRKLLSKIAEKKLAQGQKFGG